jgi:tRNA 5-methylaminomethyl-2-thiouridine biosynthesis bifunctional protein
MESVLSARNSLGFWKARGVALGGVALVVGGRLSALLAEWRREWAALGGDRGWLDLVRVGCVAEGDALRAEGLLAVPGMDRLSWDAERVRLTLARGDEATVLARLAVRADWIGVGAERGGWSLRLLARVAAPGAVLEAEGLNAGEVGELRRCGFEIESELGGRIRGRFRVERERTRERTPGGDDCRGGELGRAVVVGGGLAGTSVVRALGRRGWAVTLVERHGGVAQEASGNRAGVLAPMMSRDDGRAARLSRACFGWLLRELRGLEARGAAVAWGDCGVLQIAKNAREQAAMEAVAADGGWDPEYVRVLSASEVGRRLGGAF